VVDTFTQDVVTGIDVLWVIDNSGSMSGEIEHLAASFATFIAGFEALGHWVVFQRMQRRRGLLSKERVVKLEALGLAWEVDKGAPNPNLQKQREDAKRPVVWPDIL
jgi:hypothetical protein